MFGIVVTDITTRCNFKCSHCLRGKRSVQDASLDMLNKFYTDGHKANLGLVSISGGEPILHPKFFEMIKLINEHGYNFNFVTNGYLYKDYEDVLKYRAKLECIIVSIDGVSKESYEKMRGIMGYEHAWETVKYYADRDVYVKVQVCLSAANKHESVDFIEKAVKYGAREIAFTGIITEYDDTYKLSNEEKAECWDNIVKFCGRYNIIVSRCAALGTVGGVDFCRALNSTCAPRLSPEGNFYTCCDIYRNGKIGNIEEESYLELFQKATIVNGYLQSLRIKYFDEENKLPWFNTCEFCTNHIEEAIRLAGIREAARV